MFPNKLNSKGGPSTDNTGAKAPKAIGPSTISCPDHLKIADLTVAKSLGPAKKCAVKIVGRKMCREKGERVHICTRCDFPIAIYGRLSPCQHAFCLDCAKTDPTCYICKERIEKIHPIKLLEGIWICSAPQCLMSYLKKDEFEDHVLKNHGDILTPCPRKGEENESEAAISAGKPTIESTVQVPAKSALSLSSSSLQRDQDGGKQPKLEPTILGPTPNVAADTVLGNSNPQGFNRVDAPNPPFTSQLSGPSITAGGRRDAQAPGGKPEHRNNS